MAKQRREIDMGFTEDRFPEGTHMCLIYDDDEQRKEIISRFLAKGISLGEQVVYFTDTTPAEEVETWLKDMVPQLPAKEEDGGFVVSKAPDVYYPAGEFVPSEMIARLSGFYDQAVGAGCPGARGTGEMSWALEEIPGSDRLMEYEALINTIVDDHPVTPICQYDARRFDGATLLNVLRVHPLMIVQGSIVRNPYYMKPQEYLQKFVPGQA